MFGTKTKNEAPGSPGTVPENVRIRDLFELRPKVHDVLVWSSRKNVFPSLFVAKHF